MKTTRIAVFAVFVVLVGQTVSAAAPADEAQEILKAAGVSGGLVVHLGCGDAPGLTAALRASDAYVVHGLSRDAEAVAGARKAFLAKGVYGPVAVMHWTGKGLPYADNLVNLLVAADLGDVAMDEVRRVLAPGGVAMVAGKKTVKPRPDTIDEWTHHLYGPGGNAVGHDTEVGPPRHLQWTAGPLWARSHGWTPSVSAMVSARGRFFAICDETLACVDGTVPS